MLLWEWFVLVLPECALSFRGSIFEQGNDFRGAEILSALKEFSAMCRDVVVVTCELGKESRRGAIFFDQFERVFVRGGELSVSIRIDPNGIGQADQLQFEVRRGGLV